MIRTLLILIFVILLAWLSQDYFTITLPSGEHPSQTIIPQKKPQVPIKKNRSGTQNHTNLLEKLPLLLKENRFYDALTFYLENSSSANREKIEKYLALLAKSNPVLALEYMQVFLDNVPQSSLMKLMITTHIAQGNLDKAIDLIIQAKENYVSEYEDKRLKRQLRDVAVEHIDRLLKEQEYAKLIVFLEEMIAYDNTDSFYSFQLAQLYVKLDKVEEASLLLEGLQYDETYAQNVKTLLNSINKEQEDEYQYAIPLQRQGEHYTVTVWLNDTAFTLMLDTGATYIFVDEFKASMLEVIRDDLRLETVGNDIHAKLCNAASMRIGSLELSNIEVTVAPFKREGIDGLLGMNFFKQFTFFLDQENQILYLNPK